MYRNVKRWFAALLALMLCLGMIQTSTFADTADFTNEQAAVSVDENTLDPDSGLEESSSDPAQTGDTTSDETTQTDESSTTSDETTQTDESSTTSDETIQTDEPGITSDDPVQTDESIASGDEDLAVGAVEDLLDKEESTTDSSVTLALAAGENGTPYTSGDFKDWYRNVFGASTSESSSTFIVSEDGSNTATLGVTGNAGKIATGSSQQDGIVFLNKQLSVDDDFILQATVKATEYDKNSQVGFGLMMRPDVGTTTAESPAPPQHVYVGMGDQKLLVSDRGDGSGAPVLREAFSAGLEPGHDYNMTLQKVDNTITAVIDGEVKTVNLEQNGAWGNGLYVGLFVARNTTVEFSNVRLAVIPANSTPTLVSTTAPTKTEYYVGNTVADVDLAGFSAVVSVGGENRTITDSDCYIKSVDFSTEGKGNGKILLDYLGCEILITVDLLKEEVTSVTIKYPPIKTDYFLNDPEDWTGFEGTVTYNSGATYNLKTLIDTDKTNTHVNGFDTTSAGTKTVTIEHEHGGVTKSASFQINVSDATLDTISLSGPNQKTFYTDVDYSDKTEAYKTGLRVIATFTNGAREVVSSGFTVSPTVNPTGVGSHEYTVTYSVGGVIKTTTYTLEVKNPELTGIAIRTYPTKSTFALGEEFTSAGIEVVSTWSSGNETPLNTSEYTVHADTFNKDALGSYTITISYNANPALTTSYVATVVEKTNFDYSNLNWESIVFGQSIDKNNKPTEVNGIITVEQGEGKGKVTDAGQDGIAYYYTTVDPNQNFVFEADVTVNYFITKSAPDNQEGFGLMVRDAINTDGDSSIFYSNAATVGGYYGRYNVFGRYGITALDQESFTNFYQYQKTNANDSNYKSNPNAYKITDDTVFHLVIAKDNTGIWATMTQGGADVLDSNANGNDNGGLNVENGPAAGQYRVYMPTDTFTSVDPDHIYLGFMAARGAKITVDSSSVQLRVTAAESDAPQEVLPADPIKPGVSITSLGTSSVADYDLKVKVNAPGLLTVKVNGETLEKQVEVTAGTQTYPITLNPENNIVQLTFEPDNSTGILTDDDTIIVNSTVVFRQYGDVETPIYASPDGSVSGSGEIVNPLDLITAINFVQPGQTIYLLAGTYNYTNAQIPHGNNGTADNYKHLVAYSDPRTRSNDAVVIDLGGGSSSTFAVSGDYWHVKGIEFINGGGLRIGGNHNLIESCKTHDNFETGLQISRTDSATSIDEWPSYNKILNCDSYNNRDSSDNNADGFAAKLTSGVGNSFVGCISYYNADDGWDLFAKASAIGAVTLDNCVAYGNGFYQNADGSLEETKGDGNGFKLGGSGVAVAHEISNSYAFGNKANGFTNNSNPLFKAVNCVSYNNREQNLELHAYTGVSEAGFIVDGFASFRDDTITSFELLSDATSFSNDISSVKDKSIIQSTENYLYDKKTGLYVNSEGVALTTDDFETLADFVPYMSIEKRFERDADGNILFYGYMQFKKFSVKEDETPGADGNNNGTDSTYIVVGQTETAAAAPRTPATGDDSNMGAYLLGLIIAFVIMSRLMVVYVKRFGKQQ